MNRCPQCKVILYNGTGACPLCQCVAEDIAPAEQERIRMRYGAGAPYPDAQRLHRMVRFALKLVLFLFIVGEATLVVINYLTSSNYWWSAITGVTLLYAYVFLVYWVEHDSGFAAKAGLQILFTILLLYEIDRLSGMHGWSLQWAIPGVILFGDAMVFLLMLLNRSRWYSYTLLLLLMGACSIWIITLYFTGHISSIVMPIICVGVTGVYILGTVIFGTRSIGRELKRRFHI